MTTKKVMRERERGSEASKIKKGILRFYKKDSFSYPSTSETKCLPRYIFYRFLKPRCGHLSRNVCARDCVEVYVRGAPGLQVRGPRNSTVSKTERKDASNYDTIQ